MIDLSFITYLAVQLLFNQGVSVYLSLISITLFKKNSILSDLLTSLNNESTITDFQYKFNYTQTFQQRSYSINTNVRPYYRQVQGEMRFSQPLIKIEVHFFVQIHLYILSVGHSVRLQTLRYLWMSSSFSYLTVHQQFNIIFLILNVLLMRFLLK